MVVERFVLGKADLQHLLEGGTLTSPQGAAQLVLEDMGAVEIDSTVSQALMLLVDGQSRLGEVRVVQER